MVNFYANVDAKELKQTPESLKLFDTHYNFNRTVGSVFK